MWLIAHTVPADMLFGCLMLASCEFETCWPWPIELRKWRQNKNKCQTSRTNQEIRCLRAILHVWALHLHARSCNISGKLATVEWSIFNLHTNSCKYSKSCTHHFLKLRWLPTCIMSSSRIKSIFCNQTFTHFLLVLCTNNLHFPNSDFQFQGNFRFMQIVFHVKKCLLLPPFWIMRAGDWSHSPP